MSFDTEYKNRKDHRTRYYRSACFDRTCRNHGACGYCYGNRMHNNKRRDIPIWDYEYGWF